MPEYPGWNLDLRWMHHTLPHGHRRQPPRYLMGIQDGHNVVRSDMLLVREVAMMAVMDHLTDKPDWHIKVFDEEITEEWGREVLAWPDDHLWTRIAIAAGAPGEPRMPKNILGRQCVDYCILELRQKGEHFNRTGIIPTLDATFGVAKSDVLVSRELDDALSEAFIRLEADRGASPERAPGTHETVVDLVDPFMFPLVYGRSRFLPEEIVGVEDAVDRWAGKGEVIPRRPEWENPPSKDIRPGSSSVGRSRISSSYWSTSYQCLPANVGFPDDDGGVKFTSYINNLHPTKYRDVYNVIEKLIEAALPLWDQCLAQDTGGHGLDGPGRHRPRIIPDDPYDDNPINWEPPSVEAMVHGEATTRSSIAAAARPGEFARKAKGPISFDSSARESAREKTRVLVDRWIVTREPVHPQPSPFTPSQVNYVANPAKTLRERFKNTGLQVIIKMTTVALTPEIPEFPAGAWRLEGLANEHIVGTALYHLADSDANTTDSYLDLRARTRAFQGEWRSGDHGCRRWMESVYGARLGARLGGGGGDDDSPSPASPCLQYYGRVRTPAGRMVAFPNVFQHRESGFRLTDPARPGRRRLVALWLVDPQTRVISTANVPPQRGDWWAERAFGGLGAALPAAGSGSEEDPDGRGSRMEEKKSGPAMLVPPEFLQLLLERGLGGKALSNAAAAASAAAAGGAGQVRLPPEVMDMVRHEMGEALPMSYEEAEQHRLKMVDARLGFEREVRGIWEGSKYEFY